MNMEQLHPAQRRPRRQNTSDSADSVDRQKVPKKARRAAPADHETYGTDNQALGNFQGSYGTNDQALGNFQYSHANCGWGAWIGNVGNWTPSIGMSQPSEQFSSDVKYANYYSDIKKAQEKCPKSSQQLPELRPKFSNEDTAKTLTASNAAEKTVLETYPNFYDPVPDSGLLSTVGIQNGESAPEAMRSKKSETVNSECWKRSLALRMSATALPPKERTGPRWTRSLALKNSGGNEVPVARGTAAQGSAARPTSAVTTAQGSVGRSTSAGTGERCFLSRRAIYDMLRLDDDARSRVETRITDMQSEMDDSVIFVNEVSSSEPAPVRRQNPYLDERYCTHPSIRWLAALPSVYWNTPMIKFAMRMQDEVNVLNEQTWMDRIGIPDEQSHSYYKKVGDVIKKRFDAQFDPQDKIRVWTILVLAGGYRVPGSAEMELSEPVFRDGSMQGIKGKRKYKMGTRRRYRGLQGVLEFVVLGPDE